MITKKTAFDGTLESSDPQVTTNQGHANDKLLIVTQVIYHYGKQT